MPMPVEDTEEDRANDIVRAAATVAAAEERAAGHQLLPSGTRLEALREEDELAITSRGCILVPLGVESTTRRVKRPGLDG